MTVYIVHAVGTDFVKVGYTVRETPERRLREIQSHSPYELFLMAQVTGCLVCFESYTHKHISEHRVRGEWFKLNEQQREELMAWMETAITSDEYRQFEEAYVARHVSHCVGAEEIRQEIDRMRSGKRTKRGSSLKGIHAVIVPGMSITVDKDRKPT